MEAIERDNPSLKGVLPKQYARPALDKHRLGELIDLIGTIGLGDRENRSKDILGRVYEYFLAQFASAEGKKGGFEHTQPYDVSIHALVKRATKGNLGTMLDLFVSIHALVKRATQGHDYRIGRPEVSIHALVKRATCRATSGQAILLVSIHALVKRATLNSAGDLVGVMFQSTPS